MREIQNHTVTVTLDFPAVDAEVFHSPDGIAYLREPGVVLLGQTAAHLSGLSKFLRDLDPSFEAYLDDPTHLDHGTRLAKFAGQVCYLSLGEGRSKNSDAAKYFENIKAQKHGSVLEHPVYTFLLYGIDRAVTHELVRHRAGKAYSQVSQRYVGPEMLRYVMPAEMQGDPELEAEFFEEIRENRAAYRLRIENIATRHPSLEGESNRDKRKRMQSFARRALANEVEAPIVVSGNVRSWRHVFTKRCAKYADRGIRTPMFEAFRILRRVNREGFSDFEVGELPDGTFTATPKHEGV